MKRTERKGERGEREREREREDCLLLCSWINFYGTWKIETKGKDLEEGEI